jgi:LysM repeat protein
MSIFRPIIISYLLSLVVLFTTTQAIASDESVVYVVEEGDYTGLIAERFDVLVADIVNWNPELNPDQIQVGQELTVFPGQSTTSGPREGVYIVQTGDVLGTIAESLGVLQADLMSWNPDLNPDRIIAGQELSVSGYARQSRRTTYVIESGDSLWTIARRFDVTEEDILSWNSDIENPNSIQYGQEIILEIGGGHSSQSVGRANGGRLVNGEQLPPHRSYVIRNSSRTWGTNETISSILSAFDYMADEFNTLSRLRVHDLSLQNGGAMSDHHSHQSGRDADISLYQDRCRGGVCPFSEVSPSNLDVAKQWAFMRHWIRHEQIEYIFLDYSLQEPLYEYVANVRHAPRGYLNEVFQYPHGRNAARGLIRHEPNHADHIHVRFSCPNSDSDCR